VVWLARVDLNVINNLVPQATRLVTRGRRRATRRTEWSARPTVDAVGPDHLWPARRATGAGPAGLRSHSCQVLARPQPDATSTTANRRARDRHEAA
jgi:hypothetical protein